MGTERATMSTCASVRGFAMITSTFTAALIWTWPVAATTYTVAITNDSGAGSLRQAMLDANAAAGPDTIRFNISGVGPFTIYPASQLPVIDDPVFIDGYSQPGAQEATAIAPATLMIVLDGSLGIERGLCFGANGDDCTVQGLVICSFTRYGVELNSDGAGGHPGPSDSNVIRGNYIGTDVTGTLDNGNSWDGIMISYNSSDNTIGGPNPADRNIISCNGWNGIRVGPFSENSNVIQGNYIGTDVTATADMGNAQDGVTIWRGIGNVVAENIIAFNAIGVRVYYPEAVGNSIASNSIHSNSALGIDLGADGVTPNDVGDGDTGPNNLQNFPELTSVVSGMGQTWVQGTLNSTPSTTFALDFFYSSSPDPSGYGEGEVFFGSAMVTTDAAGYAGFFEGFWTMLPYPSCATATATDPAGNTSEFSDTVAVVPVELSSFTATCEEGAVRLEWTTQSETDNLGFYVYRSVREEAQYRQLTRELIPGAGNSTVPREYSYVDRSVRAGTRYYYKLADIDVQGTATMHGPVSVLVLPVECVLGPSHPNPFSEATTVRLNLTVAGRVRLTIHNPAGELVRTLADGHVPPGVHSFRWDGRDEVGNALSPGTYTCRAEADAVEQSRRLVLVR